MKSKAGHRTWPVDVSPSKVARRPRDHWLNDVCPACTGRAYESVRGQTTVMSDIACRACAGSGTRAVQAPHKTLHLIEDMLEALNATSATARRRTVANLKPRPLMLCRALNLPLTTRYRRGSEK
ncbi:hypothetical protein [Janthinobacterium sp. PSPC3-1]|uniref:hypothetical protein n=1 Tax=Janthinobacterium sp. PSPC3-1 TaxID=2804653 RepID=UPI003CF8ED15